MARDRAIELAPQQLSQLFVLTAPLVEVRQRQRCALMVRILTQDVLEQRCALVLALRIEQHTRHLDAQRVALRRIDQRVERALHQRQSAVEIAALPASAITMVEGKLVITLCRRGAFESAVLPTDLGAWLLAWLLESRLWAVPEPVFRGRLTPTDIGKVFKRYCNRQPVREQALARSSKA